MIDNIDSFISSIKKVKSKRVHKVNNSLGVYDAYKYIRKNNWMNIGRTLTEHEFYSIIRAINKALGEEISMGNDIILPNRLGRIEVRKYASTIRFKDGILKTNLPVDWDKTLRLWYSDEESRKNKKLIRLEEKEIFKIYYNRIKADYTNKSFYQFNVNREIKKKLKQNIKKGIVDAFNFK